MDTRQLFYALWILFMKIQNEKISAKKVKLKVINTIIIEKKEQLICYLRK